MTRIGVVGHVEWVDFLTVPRFPRRGEVIHAEGGSLRAGGGGGVAASVLAEMGAQVDFFTALGDDDSGRAALAQLEQRGVHMQVAWRAEPTRRAVTLLEPSGERTIVTIGDRLEPRGSDELDWQRLREAGSVYFTAGDAGALERARQAAVVVASPRARAVLETSTVDALVFSENDPDESEWAKHTAAHARLLVATEGERGGRWWGESQGRWTSAPLPGPARDSYGCGDSFAAAFTLGLGRGDSVDEAAAFGAQWGALALTRVGAP
ncbi:MAG TPA: PfkB family carbohydrate kinase [Solirubrobacteraceae bacterium]|nr:PfkB family carbohydrate kinase [Solirubrobacteraceae bacterium]